MSRRNRPFLKHPLCANCMVVSNKTILKVRLLSWQRFPSKQQYVYFYLILNYPTGQLPQAGGLMYPPKIEACYMHSFITENSICPFLFNSGPTATVLFGSPLLQYSNTERSSWVRLSNILTVQPMGHLFPFRPSIL